MEISMDDLRVKLLTIHLRHTATLHHRVLNACSLSTTREHDSDCYIQEDDRSKKLRGQSEETDHEQDKEDDRPPQDGQDTMPEPCRFGPRRTRQTTRMESYKYPAPVIPGGDDGAGPLADYMHDASQDDKNDINGSIQAPMENTSKPLKRSESATPRTTTPREPRSGTSAPTGENASGHQYDLRTLRPSTATEVSAVWPPLSAPGATIYDQHDATSTPAATSPRGDGSAANSNYADM
jgi:hypothetical protein